MRVIEDIKKRALHRTKIIEGQLRGIEKMIENDDYCVDIITLSLAVQGALLDVLDHPHRLLPKCPIPLVGTTSPSCRRIPRASVGP